MVRGVNTKTVVIGGCGHVGLPLAVVNASLGRVTCIYDIDEEAIATVRAGRAPFMDHGLEPLLQEVVANGTLTLSTERSALRDARFVVLIIRTPVDEYLNPEVGALFRAIDPCLPHMAGAQALILRSTVYPGTSRKIQDFFIEHGLDVQVAFCPERIAQGYAVRELRELPQIISAFSEVGLDAAHEFFEPIAPSIITLPPAEAELAKLFTNAYRYIEFATVNQLYMIAEARGADYHRIQDAIKQDYPRLAHLPGPGFAAGPCLLKDTKQLAAFHSRSFSLGHAALGVNEGLPDFIVVQLKKKHRLRHKTVGILGMAFKAESDDKRDSLSYKLRKLLRLEAGRTLCHDPYVRDPGLVPLDTVLAESDIIIVATPHRAYRDLEIPAGKDVVDVWNCLPPVAARSGV
jgi:UDP-N-acetyl-D-mannosaminuronic acid dehydrogenase